MAHRLMRDFISQENRKFTVKLGEVMASALTGFVFGVIAASLIWMIAIYYINTILYQ